MTYFSDHYKANCEKMKQQSKEYYKRNCDKIRQKAQEDYKNNPEKYLQRCHDYYVKNKDKTLARSRRWGTKAREANIQLLIENGLLTDCVVCGFSKELFAAIDFHHIDPKTKKSCISNMMRQKATPKLFEEASKCVCLCRNCHQLYHAGNEFVIEKYNQVIKERNK